MEEAMVKETFHQVMLHVGGICGVIGMLSLPRCSWCLEVFASEDASQCWIKTSAGKSSVMLANWPCLDSVEVSFKNYPLNQCYWWKLSGWSTSRERGWSPILPVWLLRKEWPWASWLCQHLSGCRQGRGHSTALWAWTHTRAAPLVRWERGMVWTHKAQSNHLWDESCSVVFSGKTCCSYKASERLEHCKPCKCSAPHLLRLLSVCVSPVLAPRNLETSGRMSSLSL